jgi:hypothetical protein
MTDRIVDEVRNARARLAARFDYDLTRIIADAMSRDSAIRTGARSQGPQPHQSGAKAAENPKMKRKLEQASPEAAAYRPGAIL